MHLFTGQPPYSHHMDTLWLSQPKSLNKAVIGYSKLNISSHWAVSSNSAGKNMSCCLRIQKTHCYLKIVLLNIILIQFNPFRIFVIDFINHMKPSFYQYIITKIQFLPCSLLWGLCRTHKCTVYENVEYFDLKSSGLDRQHCVLRIWYKYLFYLAMDISIRAVNVATSLKVEWPRNRILNIISSQQHPEQLLGCGIISISHSGTLPQKLK